MAPSHLPGCGVSLLYEAGMLTMSLFFHLVKLGSGKKLQRPKKRDAITEMDGFPMAVPLFDLRSGCNLKHPLICSACCGKRKQISCILSVALSRAQQAVAEVSPLTDVLNVSGGVGPPTPLTHTHTHEYSPNQRCSL